jgi:hypothetical protein
MLPYAQMGRQQLRAFDEQTSPEAQQAHYRARLLQLSDRREFFQTQAANSGREIAQMLPAALQAGVSVVEAAQITGISRPTLYRMLAAARHERDPRDLVEAFANAIEMLPPAALPYEIAEHFGVYVEDVLNWLAQTYPLVRAEFESFGPGAATVLIEKLPELGVPERIVLPMLLLQQAPTERVAWSTKLPDVQVLAWAALGLLRLLPLVRFLLRPGDESAPGQHFFPSDDSSRSPIGERHRPEIGES